MDVSVDKEAPDTLTRNQRRKAQKKLNKQVGAGKKIPATDDDIAEAQPEIPDLPVLPLTLESEKGTQPAKKKKKINPRSENVNPAEPAESPTNLQDRVQPLKGPIDLSSLTKSQRRKLRKKDKRKEHPSSSLQTPDVSMEDGESSKFPSLVPEGNIDGEKESIGFTIIGPAKNTRKAKLPPFLPLWYSNPSPISRTLNDPSSSIDAMTGLAPHLLKILREQGIEKFFPVQQCIIPELMQSQSHRRYFTKKPRDLCVCTPTGSGKTLAYVLPIVQDLMNRSSGKVRALILLPVKELAIQVADVFNTFAAGTRVKVGLLCGKMSVEKERQELFAKDGLLETIRSNTFLDEPFLSQLHVKPRIAVDVIVATPGRLVEHIYDTPDLDLTGLEYLVVDEADRMIEELKNNWFRLLERAVFGDSDKRPPLDFCTVNHFAKPHRPLQKLLFSATLSYDPQRFEILKLHHPKLFSVVEEAADGDIMMQNDKEVVGKYVTPEGLTEMFAEADSRIKPLILLYLIHELKWTRLLVFTNSLESTHRLFLLIKLFEGNRKINVQEISSSVHQRKRMATLEAFEKGAVDVVVASDSMARGIDLPNVEHVVLYDIPLHAKTYIHRSGRTARAGRKGTVLTMITQAERRAFGGVMKELKKKFPEKLELDIQKLAPMEEKYKKALQALETELQPKWT